MFDLARHLVIGLAAVLYLSGAAILLGARSFAQGWWNSLFPAPDTERGQTRKAITVEHTPCFSPVSEADLIRNVGAAASPSLTGTEGTNAEALTGVPPYTSRVVEMNDENGKQNLWLSTLCLN